MNKKIIFINTQSEDILANDFYENLAAYGFKLDILTNNDSLIDFFNKNHWPNKKILKLISPEKNWFSSILFLLFFPFIFLFYFFIILIINQKNKIQAIISLSYYEKIVFTVIAKILRIKSFWLEFPGQNYHILSALYLSLYRFNSRWTKLIILNSYTGHKLEKIGIKQDKIILLLPGISHNSDPHQQNIFSQIATSEQKNKNRKFFVLGTSADLNSKQQLEAIFWAIKKCIHIIPNIQLIVYGDGKERKNLLWMAKKMEIANLIWFVGEQGSLKKWLNGFDVYIVSSEILKLSDIIASIQAASTGLPIIAPDNIGLDDIVKNNLNGILTNFNSSDQLAASIISLQQNKNQQKQFGLNSQEIVDKNFTTDRMMTELDTLFT